MKSHCYEFRPVDLISLIGLPLASVIGIGFLLQLGAFFGCLPHPWPALDMDRTILLHQVAASQSTQKADLILLGDSSCLMDVEMTRLNQFLPAGHQALNLGTLSYLDLAAYRMLLQQYQVHNPNQIRWVVLLMHPEALRRFGPADYYVQLLNRYLAGGDFHDQSGLFGRINQGLGLDILRGRLLSRLVPNPLPLKYASCYGFTLDLWRWLTLHQGSLGAHGYFHPQPGLGNAEYRLAAKLETDSRSFQSALPPGVRLLVAITPSPQGFVTPDYPAQHQHLLLTWCGWLKAQGALTNLPAMGADALFADTTHLNETGAQVYTRLLANELAKFLIRTPSP